MYLIIADKFTTRVTLHQSTRHADVTHLAHTDVIPSGQHIIKLERPISGRGGGARRQALRGQGQGQGQVTAGLPTADGAGDTGPERRQGDAGDGRGDNQLLLR